MIKLLERAWDIIAENQLPYFALNLLFYGIVILLMIYAAFDAPMQKQVLATNATTYMTGALSLTDKTMVDREVLSTLGATFLINLLGVSYGSITFPSFLVPFAGIPIGLYHAVIWGIIFSPINPAINKIFLSHIPTLLLEGQAYIMAMLGAYIQGRALLWPGTVGKMSRWKGYVEGVRQTGTLYMFIMALLLIAALYGVIEVGIMINGAS